MTDQTVVGIVDTKSQPGAGGADVKLLPISYRDPNSGQMTFGSIIRGIRYAADKGADVINVSIGLEFDVSTPEGTMSSAIQYAEQKGSIVVTASGNRGFQHLTQGVNLDGSPVSPIYPAFSDDPSHNGLGSALSNLLTVTAVDGTGALTRGTNGLLIPNWGQYHVDMGAKTNSEGLTSYAAAYASGVTGVIAALTPGWSAEGRISHLKQHVDLRTQTVGNWSVTGGNLSAAKAVQALNISSMGIDDTPNSGSGYSRTGTWSHWSGSGYLNDHSTANGVGSAASATATATWTFTNLTPGRYRVRGTWVQANNRASDAPYTIKDGGATVATVRMDQRQNTPVDVYDAGAAWWFLGGSDAIYSITGTTLSVQLGNNANNIVVADGMQVERMADPQYPDDADGSSGDYARTGTWSHWTGSGYQDDHSTANGVGAASSPTATATWTFNGLTPGRYRVLGTWVQAGNRASDAPFTIRDGGTVVGTPRMDQRSGVSVDQYKEGSAWWYLGGPTGIYTVTGSTLTVQLANNAGGTVVADAIRIERLGTPQIIDDSFTASNGFAKSGTWSVWAGSGHAGGHSTASGVGTAATATATATWTFTNLIPGRYRVRATWVQASNRASDAPFTIKDGGTTLATVRMDQRQNTQIDQYDAGVAWWVIGGPGNSYTITGSTLVVQLGNNANNQVVADGVAIERVYPLRLAAGGRPPRGGVAFLVEGDLPAVTGAAIDGWRGAGITSQQADLLSRVKVRVANLGGATLGLAVGDTIWIDDDAAGYGWFVDPTPRDDSEFSRRGTMPARRGVDLLTVLAHELGHVLGLDDLDMHSHENELMTEALRPGVRLRPGHASDPHGVAPGARRSDSNTLVKRERPAVAAWRGTFLNIRSPKWGSVNGGAARSRRIATAPQQETPGLSVAFRRSALEMFWIKKRRSRPAIHAE